MQKFEMSMAMNFAFLVDNTLLMRIFAVSDDAVSVDVSPQQSDRSPPAAILARFGSSFSGRTSATVPAQVAFLFAGT